MNFPTLRYPLLILAASLILHPFVQAAKPAPLTNIDFTKGGKPPKEAAHDWNLGATGARGWIYSEQLATSKARQIYITQIAKGSPAEKVLKMGDVILGVGGKDFAYDPRTEFGKALTLAESEAGKGELKLKVWRAGSTLEATLNLPVLGSYSATAPYDCPKSKKILELGCEALAKRMTSDGYRVSAISRSLNAMALLASGEEKYLPTIKKEAEWAAKFDTDGFKTWPYGYVITFLAEYIMVTGDKSVLPGLRRLAMEAAKGQSLAGSWGHRFTNETGRIGGYGMMNAPSIPLAMALELSRRAGVGDEEIQVAIKRSSDMFRFYIGKGAIGYGDHRPWMRTHEDNGKCGMAAVFFNLLKEPEGSKYFSRMSLAAHGAERDSGHTGNFWNMTWAMPGVNQSGPVATGAWMKEFGSWYYDLARGHDGLFRHQGPPAVRHDKTKGWDASGSYLLAYAMPKKLLLFTGSEPATTDQLDAREVASIINNGRGWTRSTPNCGYDELPTKVLINRLNSWSPIVRQRAANEIWRRGDIPLEPIIALLDAESIEARLGACATLAQLKERATPAISKLRSTLKADHMWLRVQAAKALASIGKPAQPFANEILKMIIRKPGPKDPRAMEQRYLCSSVFGRKGLLWKSMEGVDRELMLQALQAGLQNQDGHCRGVISQMYVKLSQEELARVMPDIHQATIEAAPSGAMFANTVRLVGLKTMADQRLEEGIDACVNYIGGQPKWGSKGRNPEALKQLLRYGVHAQHVIPKLEEIATRFDKGETHFPIKHSKAKAVDIRKAIEDIKKSTKQPELKSFK